jgi:hypothetical protein
MKQFAVDIDITVSKRIYVDAENEQQAREIVEEKMKYPHYYYTKADAYVKHEITDVNEEEPDEDDDLGGDLREAIAYVREQLGEERLLVVRAQANLCCEQRRPVDTDYNDEVHDLLEEWGEEHDLCEEWWSESIELEDIIVRL